MYRSPSRGSRPLRLSIVVLVLVLGAASALIVACGGQDEPTARPAPTAAPAVQPTTAPVATPTKAPVATPTTAPVATPTTAPVATPTVAQPTAAPAARPGEIRDVPRDRTVRTISGGREGKFIDQEVWNPYAVAGVGLVGYWFFEPLYFFSAFENKEIPWLATQWEYNSDYTTLTYKLRPGVSWSDGTPFSANDVVYTYNTLRDLGPSVRWGRDVQNVLDRAEAVDPLTVTFRFKRPAPKFHYFISYKFDIGVYIVPKHVYEGKDWKEFKNYDPAKGWPLTTGPWRVAASTPEQKLVDRVSAPQDWWASRTGHWRFPEVERVIVLPLVGATQAAASILKAEVEYAGPGLLLSVATHEEIQRQNPEIITHNGRNKPYGFLNWFTASLEFNNQKFPYNDKNVRWALSYFIDRQQMIDVAFRGAGSISRVPWPAFAPLQPFTDAIEPLLVKYPTHEFSLEKGAARLRASGWEKDSAGFWSKNGQRLSCKILSYSSFAAQGPVIAEQLRRAGVEADFSMPPDYASRRSAGEYECSLNGHGGSVGNDPYFTFRLYQCGSNVPGADQVNVYRFCNPEFDKIMDEMAVVPFSDQAKLKQLTIKAMQIWLEELPDAQVHDFYQAPAINTHYWTNWSTYQNGRVGLSASPHLTETLVLYELRATNAK